MSSGDYHTEIGTGLLVLAAVSTEDTEKDIEYVADKVANLRIFSDQDGKLNLSVKDVGGDILAVSQFTIYGDCKKGRRPSFSESAPREKGEKYFNLFVDKLANESIKIEKGLFGADMAVKLINDGPVTLIVES